MELGDKMLIDEKIQTYYLNNVKQIFVYLTSNCQLRCKQCLYKPLLSNTTNDAIPFEILSNLLETFHQLGAFKISFLGGEPTIYHDEKSNRRFSDVVHLAKEIGYEYIRVDTNGQFSSELLTNQDITRLDEITFSLDGFDENTNDLVRGAGVFNKSVDNIKHAISLGYNVQITCCVHHFMCPDLKQGLENIQTMIKFADDLGVGSINFHPILRVGVPRDSWIEGTYIDPVLWVNIYKEFTHMKLQTERDIKIRLPMRYISELDFSDEAVDYCPLKMGERALIMPDGQIKACAFTIGTPFCVAQYSKEKIDAEHTHSELSVIGNKKQQICCFQKKMANLIPLCMSYKPNQVEPVWLLTRKGR